MAFSDTSESLLSFIAETTFGTTPATPVWKTIRITSESLALVKKREVDPSVRGNPRPDAKKTLSQQVTGSISGIVRFGAEFDALLEWATRATFSTNVLKCAALAKSISIEKKHVVGGTPVYFRFTGVRCSQMKFGISAEGFITWTADVLGVGHTKSASIVSGATYTAASTTVPMVAPEVTSLTVAAATTNPTPMALNLTINNNCATQPAIGSLAVAGIRYGDQNVTGDMEAYFDDGGVYEAFLAETQGAISWTIVGGANSYNFNMTKCTPDSANAPIGGNNQDVKVQMAWEAVNDSTPGTHLTITKV